MTQYTTASVLALRIRYSTLELQYQFCWCTLLSHCQSYCYYTVHFCPSTSPNDRHSQCLSRYYHCAVPFLLIRQPTSVPVPADMKQSTTAPIQDILIRKSTTALYQSYWYLTDTSSSDIQQSTTALILILLIPYNPQLPQYMPYWYDTTHYCPSTSPT